MRLVLLTLAGWFALSVFVAVVVGRLLRASPGAGSGARTLGRRYAVAALAGGSAAAALVVFALSAPLLVESPPRIRLGALMPSTPGPPLSPLPPGWERRPSALAPASGPPLGVLATLASIGAAVGPGASQIRPAPAPSGERRPAPGGTLGAVGGGGPAPPSLPPEPPVSGASPSPGPTGSSPAAPAPEPPRPSAPAPTPLPVREAITASEPQESTQSSRRTSKRENSKRGSSKPAKPRDTPPAPPTPQPAPATPPAASPAAAPEHPRGKGQGPKPGPRGGGGRGKHGDR